MAGALAILAATAGSASAVGYHTYQSQLTKANGTDFTNPWGVAVDSSNDLWVFDQGASVLSKFNSSGTYLAQNGGTGSWEGSPYIQGLAYGKTANLLYPADSGADDLWGVHATDASYAGVDLGGQTGNLGGGCCYIYDAVDNSGAAGTDGDIYVAGGNFLLRDDNTGAAADFSGSAEYISANQLTGTPTHPFISVEAVATDTAGDVYVADNGRHEIDEFASTGIFVQSFSGELGFVSSLAVDPTNGDLFAGDSAKSVVHQFSSSGQFVGDIDGSATPAGSFMPQGLAADSSGKLYVSDGAHAVVDAFPSEPPPAGSFPLTVSPSGAGKVDGSPGAISACRSSGGTCSDSYAGLGRHPHSDRRRAQRIHRLDGKPAARAPAPARLSSEATGRSPPPSRRSPTRSP